MDSIVVTPRTVIPSVVFLRSRVPAAHPSAPILGEERMGSGVVVDEHRVLTAHYLLLGASEVEVTAADGRARPVERTIADHETGLGLVQTGGPELRPARLDRPERVAPGLPVFLLTCTSAEERKGATGHVSWIGPFEAFWEYMLDRAIMTTVVNPGLAGAPLFDVDARLVGIVSLGLAAVGRYSLAIPLELYQAHRAELLGEVARSRPARAWVGFYPHAYDGGVVVTGVIPNGPAERAGMAQGDMILSVDGKPVQTLRELYRELWRRKPGESLGFGVLRDASLRVVEVLAGDRYEFYK
jgi:S1-C subfamily serine protease